MIEVSTVGEYLYHKIKSSAGGKFKQLTLFIFYSIREVIKVIYACVTRSDMTGGIYLIFNFFDYIVDRLVVVLRHIGISQR